MDTEPLLVAALRGLPLERPPVWLMRQAGRYMPQYRELKERHSFLELCRRPELAVEVSLQPIDQLDVDAAIIFSDILIPLTSLGIEIEFNPGPHILNPLRDPRDFTKLGSASLGPAVGYVFDAVAGLRAELAGRPGKRKAVIGFAGAPWTLACYLTAQGPYKHFQATSIFAHEHPREMEQLLDRLTTLITDYLMGQVAAGADAVQLFDSWGGILDAADYRQFSLPYLERIISAVQDIGCPVILFVGNSSHLLAELGTTGATAISIDWRTSLSEAARQLGDRFILQGNLDPTQLFGSIPDVVDRTTTMLRQAPHGGRYIANLGHGILQTTPVENVEAFVRTVQNYRSLGKAES